MSKRIPGPKSRFVQNAVRSRQFPIFVLMMTIIVVVSLRTPAFLSLGNFEDIMLDIAMLAIVSIGQMIVMITTGIDISVGSILAFSAMAVGSMVRANPEITPIIAILFGSLIGAALGCLNSFVITAMKIPPIITTLGTMSFFRGLVYVISQGTWVMSHQLPERFKEFTIQTDLGLPFLVIIALVLGVISYLFVNRIPIGRQIYAVGCNQKAARLAGIRVKRVEFLAYAISGLLSGVAGVMWVSRYAIAANNTATGFETQTIAACVIGGVSVFGGIGNIPGVFLGAFFIGMINNAINLIGISEFWKQAFYGMAIILAVVLDAVFNNRFKNMRAKNGEK